MSTRNVLLVRPLINRRKNAPFFLPLGLLCLTSPLREAGHQVEIIDFEYLYRSGKFALDDERWLEDIGGPIIDRAPMILGLTTLADTLPICLLIGRYVKERRPDTTVVLGGPGVFASFPKLLQQYHDAVDYVCVNEGERCLVELADRLAAGEDHPLVAGFHTWINGNVVDCGHRPLANINELPMPAYDAVDVPSYLALASPRIFDVYVGSGCTYACKFCVTSTFWERTFRSKSPEIILRELDVLYDRFGITRVNFLHDNFANRKGYLNDFVDYFLAHNTRYEWGCALRPDSCTREQLERMKQAGCFNIFCGTDAGSPKILRQMAKMPNASRSYTFFRNCRDIDLRFETNTIIGYPDESDADLEDSLQLVFSAVAHGATISDISILQPLPGADVTAAHMDHLTFIEQQSLGTFSPPEALGMARAHPEIFPGFYFIRYQNQSFAWYVHMANRIRYFTRHWFRTLYFLTQCAGFRYVDLLSELTEDQDVRSFGEQFERQFALLDLPPDVRELAEAIFAFDRIEAQVKSLDVSREIEDVYSAAPVVGHGKHYILAELAYPVHELFATMPELSVDAVTRRPTIYLWVRDRDGDLITISLRPWQRALWQRLEAADAGPDYLRDLINSICAGGIGDPAAVSDAVERTATYFQTLLAAGDHEDGQHNYENLPNTRPALVH